MTGTFQKTFEFVLFLTILLRKFLWSFNLYPSNAHGDATGEGCESCGLLSWSPWRLFSIV